jgi:hypothetical protein
VSDYAATSQQLLPDMTSSLGFPSSFLFGEVEIADHEAMWAIRQAARS